MKRYIKYILLLLIVIIGGYRATYAKYVSSSDWNYHFKTNEFYFNSDFLGTSLVKNVDTLWDGGSINFNVRNNLNQTVITKNDINYTVTCTIEGAAALYSECDLNGTGANTVDSILPSIQICSNTTNDGVDVGLFNQTECELGGYEWIDQISTADFYFDVILTDTNYEINDITVNVTATSTSPYSETLTGNFILYRKTIEEDKITMDFNNYTNYDRLDISNTYNTSKCVKLTWDANKLLIAAEGNEFSSFTADANGYINEVIFNIAAKKSVGYQFYRRIFNTTYNITEFTITETTGC